MIIDSAWCTKRHDILAQKFNLKPWQSGLLGDSLYWHDIQNSGIRLRMDKHLVKTANMGPQAGHTYFARMAALSEFPIRTKVYVTNQGALWQFSDLLLKPNKCHEIVDILHEHHFAGYNGDPVDLVVFDMAGEPQARFAEALNCLFSTLSTTTAILLLQPGNNF